MPIYTLYLPPNIVSIYPVSAPKYCVYLPCICPQQRFFVVLLFFCMTFAFLTCLFVPSAPSWFGAWFVSTPAAGRQVWPSVLGSKTMLCDGTSKSVRRARAARAARLCTAATLRHARLSAAQLHCALCGDCAYSCSLCWCCYLWKPVCCLNHIKVRYYNRSNNDIVFYNGKLRMGGGGRRAERHRTLVHHSMKILYTSFKALL